MTLGSGCPCDRRGTEDSGAKWGHLGKVDVLLLLGFSGILQDEVQLLTWLQDDVNLPNFSSWLLWTFAQSKHFSVPFGSFHL